MNPLPLPDAHVVTDWLLRTSLQVALLVAVILLVTALLGRRLSPGCRYALWLLVALRLALPVLPASGWSVFNLFGSDSPRPIAPNTTAPAQPETGWIITKDPLPLTAPQVVGQIGGGDAGDWTWHHVVLLLWAAGTALFMARIVIANIAFARRIRRATGVDDAGVLALLCACQRQMNVRRPIRIIETDAVNGPALWGLTRPTLLLPPGMLRTLSRDDLRFVFLHELAHLKRRDIALDWCLALLHALHWFNPAAWFALARLRAERELSRDAMVLALSHEPDEHGYGHTILRLVESISRPAALRPGTVGILEEKTELKRRIAMIAQFDRNRSRGRMLAIALAALIASVLLTDKRTVDAAPVPTQDDAPARALPEKAERPQPIPDAREKLKYPPDWPDAAPATLQHPDADAAANKKLDRRLPEVRFDNVAFSDAVEFLRDISGANIFVNWVALEKAGIERNTPITTRLKDVKLSRALEHVLQNLGGGKVEVGFIVQNGVITISTQEDLDRDTDIAVYDVRDLIVVDEKDEKRAQTLQEELVREIITLLQETVAPRTWIDKGGKTASVRHLAGQLIITHTPRHHAQIRQLLIQLREARAVQIIIEARFITTRPELVERHKLKPGQDALVFWDDAHVQAFLRDAQAEIKTAVLAAPRLLLINGQRGEVKIGAEIPSLVGYNEKDGDFQPVVTYVHEGTSLGLTATTAADRKSITLTTNARNTKVLDYEERAWDKSPPGKDLKLRIPRMAVQSFESVISIPDGGTLAAMLEPQDEANAKQPQARTVVLLKPRVIIQREVEQQAFPGVNARDAAGN